MDEGSLVSVAIFKSVLNLLCEHSKLSKLIILGKLKYCWNPNCLFQITVISRLFWGFPGGSLVKSPPANAGVSPETWVQSLGWEDPLENEMATHSGILAWKIP